jgi:hypothetical protein
MLEDIMQELLGRTFSVGDGEYRVVDVRRMSGELMVYAETVAGRTAQPRKPKRAAFHYGDIATRIGPGEQIA